MFNISTIMSGKLSEFFGVKTQTATEPVSADVDGPNRSQKLEQIIRNAQQQGQIVSDIVGGGVIVTRGTPGFCTSVIYDAQGQLLGKHGRGLNMF